MPKTLLCIKELNVGIVLAMIYSDGSVEYRDRTSMELLPRDGIDQISSLAQVGFNFPLGNPCESPLVNHLSGQ